MSDSEGRDGGLLLSLDNVAVRLPLARAGSRCLAAMVDYFFWGLVMLALAMAFLGAGIFLGTDGAGAWLVAAFVVVTLLVDVGFFAGQEILLGGQTLGKRLADLRVVSRRGSAAGALPLLVRNLVRSLDLLFGVPLMVLDPSARRIGDRLAGTLVVHVGRAAADPSATTVRRAPEGWGLERLALVERLLERTATLAPKRAATLASRILAAAERDDSSFLEHVPATLDPATRLMIAFAGEGADGP